MAEVSRAIATRKPSQVQKSLAVELLPNTTYVLMTDEPVTAEVPVVPIVFDLSAEARPIEQLGEEPTMFASK